jgi:hypothetical protein
VFDLGVIFTRPKAVFFELFARLFFFVKKRDKNENEKMQK